MPCLHTLSSLCTCTSWVFLFFYTWSFSYHYLDYYSSSLYACIFFFNIKNLNEYLLNQVVRHLVYKSVLKTRFLWLLNHRGRTSNLFYTKFILEKDISILTVVHCHVSSNKFDKYHFLFSCFLFVCFELYQIYVIIKSLNQHNLHISNQIKYDTNTFNIILVNFLYLVIFLSYMY